VASSYSIDGPIFSAFEAQPAVNIAIVIVTAIRFGMMLTPHLLSLDTWQGGLCRHALVQFTGTGVEILISDAPEPYATGRPVFTLKHIAALALWRFRFCGGLLIGLRRSQAFFLTRTAAKQTGEQKNSCYLLA
jgi:hypothetical protein